MLVQKIYRALLNIYLLIYIFYSKLATHCPQEINAVNSFDQCIKFRLIYLPNQSKSS